VPHPGHSNIFLLVNFGFLETLSIFYRMLSLVRRGFSYLAGFRCDKERFMDGRLAGRWNAALFI